MLCVEVNGAVVLDRTVLAALIGVTGSLLGASVGAAIGIWYAKVSNRERRTMDLFASYQNDVFPKQGMARAALSFAGEPEDLPKQEREQAKFVGNWYDVYAALALEGGLSPALRARLRIDSSVIRFWCQYSRSRFKEVVEPKEWPNMRKLVEGRRNRKGQGEQNSEPTKWSGTRIGGKMVKYKIPVTAVRELHAALRKSEKESTEELGVVVLIPALAEGGDVQVEDVGDVENPNFCPKCGKPWNE